MTKTERLNLLNKYNGKCAYCGVDLKGKFQADHINPIHRGYSDFHLEKMKVVRGLDIIQNITPACRRCNAFKSTFTLEKFREEISEQVKRTRRYSFNFRLAEDYGLVKETNIEVKFYFETL